MTINAAAYSDSHLQKEPQKIAFPALLKVLMENLFHENLSFFSSSDESQK